MLEKDIEILRVLAEEYSPEELVSELVSVLIERADDLSDLGLKEQAHNCAEIAHRINEAYDPEP